MKILNLLVPLLILGACSSDGSSSFPFANALNQVGFSNSILQPKTRFLGFSSHAHRVAVIDPILNFEVTAYQLDERYQAATELVSLDNIAVFSQSKITILSGDEKLTESLAGWRQWDKSENVAALVFSSHLVRGAKVIRNKAPGVWQMESFGAPWGSVGSQRIVSFIRDDGLEMVMTDPVNGYYGTFEAPSLTQDIAGPVLNCAAGLIGNGEWTAALYDSPSNTIFMGNENGDLAKLELNKSTSCQPVTSWDQVSLPAAKVISIREFSDSELVVSNVNGDIFVLAKSDLSTRIEKSDFCAIPISPFAMTPTRIAYVCLQGQVSASGNGFDYNEAFIEVYDFESSAIEFRHKLDFDNTANIAVDVDTQRIYVLSKSATGVLTTLDIPIQTTSVKNGLFLDGILKRFLE